MSARLAVVFVLLIACLAARAGDDSSEWKRLDREGEAALKKNDFAKAEKLLIAASQIAEKFGPQDKRYAETFRSLGDAFFQMRRFGLAADVYRRVADADGQRLGTNELAVADDLLRFVEMAGYAGDFENGRDALERATSIVRQKSGGSSYAMGICYARRGDLELQEAHLAVAETNFSKALELLETEKTLHQFSGTGLQMRTTVYIPAQASVAQVLNQLGICQTREKKYTAAEASFLRSIKLLKWEYGDASGTLANPCYNLGRCYLEDGKFADAETMVRRGLSIIERVDPSNSSRKDARILLSKVLIAEGKFSEAKKFAE